MDTPIKEESFLSKNYKLIIIVICIIILISLLIYYFIKKSNNSAFLKSAFRVNNALSENSTVYPNCEIPEPLNYINYSINMKIYIDNFYENFGSWRHIFHKGSAIADGKYLNYRYIDEINDGWDELTSDIPQQNPGLWLHPNNNNLRFAIQTEYNYDYCPEPHADQYSSVSKNRGKEPSEHANEYSLQYFDIEDIPIKTEVSLTFVINNNTINVYFNGILKNIFTVKGIPAFNKGPLYLHHPNTYSGELKVYEYYPQSLNEININKITK